MPEYDVPTDIIKDGKVWLPRLLSALGLVSSNSEGRRLIQQGAVEINGVRHADPNEEIEVASLHGAVIRVGKLRFARVR
ncbi:Tyrosine--tRNA ligase [bacterium HR16]|nr:Tyrosine--tRNA ligase [bacterium HR16]